MRSFIVSRLSSDEFNVNQEELLEKAILKIKEDNIKKRLNIIARKIANAEKMHQDSKVLNELLHEKMYLDEELKKIKVSKSDRT